MAPIWHLDFPVSGSSFLARHRCLLETFVRSAFAALVELAAIVMQMTLQMRRIATSFAYRTASVGADSIRRRDGKAPHCYRKGGRN